MNKYIVLVRHASTVANELNNVVYSKVEGQRESPISEYGILQARSLQNNLLLKDSDVVLSSSSNRAIDTARHSLGVDLKNVITDDRLLERSLGEIEGRNTWDLQQDKRLAQYFVNESESRRYRHSFTHRFPKGENYTDVIERTKQCLEDHLAKIKPGGKIIIFSHMVSIRCMLHYSLSLSETQTLNLKIDNCIPILISTAEGVTGKLITPTMEELLWK